MQGGCYITLSHVVEKCLIKVNDVDEVLPSLPYDAASTIAVAVVSSFSADCSTPVLNTELKFNWMTQAVAYCLTLPTLYQDAIQGAIRIFEFWLLKNASFLPVSKQNEYARQFIKYMSIIFEYKYDEEHPSLRETLILQLEESWGRCIEESTYFDEETWDVLLRVLVGCTDYLISEEANRILTETIAIQLASKCFKLIFLAAEKSNITKPVTWKIIKHYINKWLDHVLFIKTISSSIYDQYVSIFDKLIDKETLTVTNADVSIESFRLAQYINAIDYEVILSEKKNLTPVMLMLQKVEEYSRSIIEKSPLLYTPRFPADIFFSFFGNWIFKPFKSCDSNSLIIPTTILMRIAGQWDLYNSKWKPLALATVCNALSLPPSAMTLSNGHLLLSGFFNDQLVNGFMQMISNMQVQSKVDNSYWMNCITLLEDISEVRKIDYSIFHSFFESCKESSTLTMLFTIIMRQNPVLFMNFAGACFRHNFVMQGPLIESVISNLNIIVAATIPYDSFELEDYINDVIEIVTERMDNRQLVSSFLILVAQTTKWRNEAFNSVIATKIIKFAKRYLNDSNNESVKTVVHMLCGRALDTTLLDNSPLHLSTTQSNVDERLYLKPCYSVMIGDDHLVSVVDDKTKKNSCIVHIREPRGFFAWKLTCLPGDNNMTVIKKNITLDSPQKAENHFVDTKDCEKGLEEEMISSRVLYKDYMKSSNHKEMPHISLLDKEKNYKKYAIRSSFVDFLIQTSLSSNIYEIKEPVDSIIEKFDAIPSSALLKVSLHHMSPDNKPISSPVYEYFKSLLGKPHYLKEFKDETVLLKNFGIAQIAFHENFESDIGIIFNESNMRININSDKIPNKELLFVVQPFQQNFYRISIHSKVKKFSWASPNARVISYNNISRTISTIAFAFLSTEKFDDIFAPNEERQKLLSSLEKTPISDLELTQRLPLNLPNLVI